MPQVSLYIEQTLYTELVAKAKEKGMSRSGYVNEMLKKYIDDTVTVGELDEFFGIFEGEEMDEPEEIPWELNAKREEI
jgi:metal-responsive CopG/Arc/MetJ family transcriptional regulator